MKIKLSILVVLTLLIGLFSGMDKVEAQYTVGTCDKATLNGYVNPNGNPTTAWFEWGPTSALGRSTTPQTYTSYSSFSAQITGLSEKTTYYYKTKFRNSVQGEWSGSLISFTTAACPQSAPTVSITANPTNISYNGTSTITWYPNNATSCTASGAGNGWTGPKSATQGSFNTGPLTVTTVYKISCTGPGGTTPEQSVTVNVANQRVLDPTVILNAEDTTLNYGESTVLHWSSQNATSCVASGGSNNWSQTRNIEGTFHTGPLAQTVTYRIVCYGNSSDTNEATASVTVNVTPRQQQIPTVTISADRTNINFGESTTIRWSSQNATSCVASGGSNNWSQGRNTQGTFNTGNLTQDTTYRIQCTGPGGTTSTQSVAVNVEQEQVSNPTVTLTADNSNLNYEGSTYIRWSARNADSCLASGGSEGWSGPKSISGFFYTGSLRNTATYTITCTNDRGGSATANIAINVLQQQNLDPSVTTNAASNIGTNSATLNGYVNSNGSTNVTSWFEWGSNSGFGNQTNQINYGSSNNFSINYNLSGLAPNTTYYFRAAARSGNGPTIYGNQSSFTTAGTSGCTYGCYNYQPIVTTYPASSITNNSATLNGYVDPNGSSSVTRWFEWGTSNNYLFTSTNRVSQTGNINEPLYNLSPNTTYYFRAAAQSSGSQVVYGNILNFTTSSNVFDACTYGSCKPTAVTTIATNIGLSSTRVNGLALVNGNVYSTGYFEYGTTTNLGSTTVSKNIGSGQSNPFYESLFNLASGTTYYFRAVVTNQHGTSRGDIKNFKTGIPTKDTEVVYKKTIVVTNTNNTVSSRPSLVLLNISKNGEIIRKGEVVEYIINYKNVSSKNLKDVILRISTPKELVFMEASRGYYSSENTTIVANIVSLNSQEEGSTRITARVSNDAEIGKIVVVTANMAYTIADNNIQEEVFAYSKNTVENGSRVIEQGALAFLFGDGFLPDTLLGWLLLILVIALVVLAIRKAYYGAPRSINISNNPDLGHH